MILFLAILNSFPKCTHSKHVPSVWQVTLVDFISSGFCEVIYVVGKTVYANVQLKVWNWCRKNVLLVNNVQYFRSSSLFPKESEGISESPKVPACGKLSEYPLPVAAFSATEFCCDGQSSVCFSNSCTTCWNWDSLLKVKLNCATYSFCEASFNL